MADKNDRRTTDHSDGEDQGTREDRGYLNTLAAVAIAPSGTGDEMSEYVAQVVGVIRDSGLRNETNAMFTNIEGDLDDVLKLVRDATLKLASQGYRTGVTLKLDIRPGFRDQMERKPELVDEILSKQGD
ncbi:thiamine-binding protein [Bifidobacterium xylocopae]|uniref:Thiamine-binding protein domain-containing protein n=1 Tax=Bifidobacterium xylocopae TaxID=2493119 RepID=A0A366KD83_9BIFI|nr:thiamine-binding protein [Bifidobacterium xylocopae]RBP99182.1 hypothetical protein CRD59_05375 [Bifidobacterium xylocopae]